MQKPHARQAEHEERRRAMRREVQRRCRSGFIMVLEEMRRVAELGYSFFEQVPFNTWAIARHQSIV